MPEDRRDQIYDKVIRTVAEIAGTSLMDLHGDTELIADLNLDSLGIFEIVIELEETFSLRISDEDIEKVRSIDQITDYIARQETT